MTQKALEATAELRRLQADWIFRRYNEEEVGDFPTALPDRPDLEYSKIDKIPDIVVMDLVWTRLFGRFYQKAARENQKKFVNIYKELGKVDFSVPEGSWSGQLAINGTSLFDAFENWDTSPLSLFESKTGIKLYAHVEGRRGMPFKEVDYKPDKLLMLTPGGRAAYARSLRIRGSK